MFRATKSVLAVGGMAGTVILVGSGMLVAPGATIGVRLAGALLAGFASYAAWRATRVGVAMLEGGVVLHGWFSTRRYRWNEIAEFEVGPGINAVQSTYTLHVHLTDGKDLGVQALSTSRVFRGESVVHRAVQELNAELARRAETS